MPPRVRFAPSPTGYLHVGGARTALFNWLFARKNHGTFILRIEDTDAARNTPAALAAIYDGLQWLGIDWDEGPGKGGGSGPYLQSERNGIYASHLQRLIESGQAYDDDGAIRLRSPKNKITVHDRIVGDVTIDRSEENDTALRRSDGSYIFHFVNVVDDIEMKVTHVIRGEDHVMNTPKHIELFEALGAPPPVFAHLPLILNMDGTKMSKRDQGSALGWYQEQGFLPEAVRNFLCLLGWSPKDDRQQLPVAEIMALFDWDHLNRSPAKFDLDKCLWLNSRYLADLSEDEYAAAYDAFIGAHPADGEAPVKRSIEAGRAALRLVRPRASTLGQARVELERLFSPGAGIEAEAVAKLQGVAGAAELCAALVECLATVPVWNEEGIRAAIATAAERRALKPRGLMMPLRLIATGSLHGPDLVPAMALRDRFEVIEEMRARSAAVFPGWGDAGAAG